MKIPFIDIHTHNPVTSEEILSVSNLFLQDIDFRNKLSTPFSAAIHPWHTTKFNIDKVSEMLENLLKQPELIAIGETGLDQASAADYPSQKRFFELHLEFATNHHKPIIIHTVKAWNDLIKYLKYIRVPVILHGYSSGLELTKQLIDLGCYFSIGKSVLQLTTRVRESIQLIPLTSLFLETDDSSANIIEIYQAVSSTKELSLDELKMQIKKNYDRLFSIFEM